MVILLAAPLASARVPHRLWGDPSNAVRLSCWIAQVVLDLLQMQQMLVMSPSRLIARLMARLFVLRATATRGALSPVGSLVRLPFLSPCRVPRPVQLLIRSRIPARLSGSDGLLVSS